MKPRNQLWWMLLLTIGWTPGAQSGNIQKLLRFPDIHGDKVVFSYAGDLWRVSDKGGQAFRITSHPGLELFAKFSQDGKWIAFTGQYTGEEQVYVMPADGGEPRQLTFYPPRGPLPPRWGYDNQVFGWHPSRDAVVFRSSRDSWDFSASKLYTIPRKGGVPEVLPLPQAGSGCFSPDGKKMLYSPLFRDFRTWKRYQGGWAQDLYEFDLVKNAVNQITDHKRTDRDPMWVDDNHCFASDRDGRLNLYCRNVKTGKLSQLTRYSEWDVRWPSEGPPGRIVYELGGEIHIFEVGKNHDTTLQIDLPSDAVARRPRWISASKNIESFGLSPHGKRVLFVARGDIFDVAVQHGPRRNLTHTSDAHERQAQWAPDGSKLVFITDQSGEDELWWLDADTLESARLGPTSKGRLYSPRWSPDGKHIAFSNSEGRILVVGWKNRKVVEIAHERYGRSDDYAWSPYGGYLAFSLQDDNQNRSLYVWSAAQNKTRRITSEQFSEYAPAWDPKGEYLYYLSLRDFRPQMDGLDFNFTINRAVGIYALALRSDLPHPFPPRNDVESEPGRKVEEDKAAKWLYRKTARAKNIRIDFENLAERLARVPVESDNYEKLHITDTQILMLTSAPWYHGRDDQKSKLEAYSKKDRKKKLIAHGVNDISVSFDGGWMLYRSDKKYNLIEIDKVSREAKGRDEKKNQVSTDELRALVNPGMEWKVIFEEVWRRYRDYFYVSNLHGFDWQGLGERYRALLPYVGHRTDLNYLIGEMIAELNVSHAYIEGGDLNLPAREPVALLGARFEQDEKTGKPRIRQIFEGHNAEPIYRAPLTEVGVNAKIGDYLLAVNGRVLKAGENVYQLLRLPGDQPVELMLNSDPTLKGARKIIVQPISDEQNLLYLAWVEKNRRYVDEKTGGRVGYLHIPDMMSDGIREFIKWFYPQTRKQGLVIDVRSNGGGHVSQLLVERLRRELLMTDFGRHHAVTTYPRYVLHGHMVCIINETSASDGDIFPWAFKKAGLGPLVGKRTWGGVVGITNHGPLLDGGMVYVPEFSNNDTEGNFIIEGIGVEPDIEIENDPVSMLAGKDLQLEKAVETALQKINQDPKKLPARRPPPEKSSE